MTDNPRLKALWVQAQRFGPKSINQLFWLAALVALCIHFLVVVTHAVNVPFWDDWDALRPGNLEHDLNLNWLISFHNNHRSFMTHLSIWVLYRLGGWNLTTQMALNFIVYSGLVIWFLRYLQRSYQVGTGLVALVPASAIADESHIHAFNGCWTFFLLFFFAAVALALRRDRLSWLAPVFAAVAMFSMFGGLICSAFFVLLSLGLALLRKDLRLRHLAHAAAVVVFMVLWFRGYPSEKSSLSWPTHLPFWNHYTNLVAWGFGHKVVDAERGTLVLLIVVGLAVAVAVIKRKAPQDERERWFALLVTLGALLAVLASISVGRAWAGPGGAKSGRYGEVALFLVPLAWVMFRCVANAVPWPAAVNASVAAMAGLALLYPLPDWFDYIGIYRGQENRRLAGLRCLHDHFYRNGNGFCPDIQYDPSAWAVEEQRAIQLHVSYLREHSPTYQ
jgi:hypothetical protein